MASTQLRLSSTFFLISTLLVLDSTAEITKSPENVIVLPNQDAILNCSTDNIDNIRWTYDHNVISSPPCIAHDSGFIASSPDPAHDCDIVAPADEPHGISGSYVCADATDKAVAMVIQLNPMPTCGPVIQHSSVAEEEVVNFMCGMTYRWHSLARQSNVVPHINVSFGWVKDSETPLTAEQPVSEPTETKEGSIAVVAQKPAIPAQKCTISFTFAPRQRFSHSHTFAVNTVSYTCSSDPIPVRHCPSTVTVSPSSGPFKVGDVLTCTSDGFPEPSYTWTDGDGVVVSTGPNITLDSTSFTLNCTATGNLRDDCSATISVSDQRATVYYATPRRHLITGGTTVYIHGTRFRKDQRAQLYVNMTYSENNTAPNITSFISDCEFNNPSRLTCVIPVLDLPDEFRNLSDPSLTFPYDDPSLNFSQVTAYNDRGSELRFTEIVLIDNETYPWMNQPFYFQFISLLPTIKDSGLSRFDVSTPLRIQGAHLDRGVTQASDYTVILGDRRCTPRGQLLPDMFQCQPPQSAPNAAGDNITRCSDGFAVTVKIGDRYLGRAGCLAYSDISAASSTDDDSHSVIYIIVIVGTIGIALIIILTAIVLRAYVSCRRHDDDERSPLGPPKDSTVAYNGHAIQQKADSDEFAGNTLEMSEYTNASEFKRIRHATSEVGCY